MESGKLFPRNERERALDSKMLPIVQRLQGENIISFEQYRKRIEGDRREGKSIDFYQTLSVFSQPHGNIKKFSSERVGNSTSRYHRESNRPHLQSLQKAVKPSQHHRHGRFLLNPASKVKKHLAQDIQCQKVYGNLFQKRQTLNRFQHFCQSIKQKNRSSHQQSRQSSPKEPIILFSSDKDIENEPIEETKDVFHITNRKKFWNQNRTQTAGFTSKLISVQFMKRLIKS